MDDKTLEQARHIFATALTLKKVVFERHFANALVGGPSQALDLTIPQMHALMVVQERGQVTIKELAKALYVSAPSASAMVERLVEEGMVSRQQSQADRREVAVRTTAKGRDGIEQMECHVLHTIVELLEKMGPEYAEKWCDVYRRLTDVMRGEGRSVGKRERVTR